jgi:monofunctional glycosyltransferase
MAQEESVAPESAESPSPPPPRRRGLRRLLLVVVAAAIAIPIAIPLVLVPVYAFVDPVSTSMLRRYLTGHPVDRQWVAIDQVSDRLKASVVMSEDGQFCRHHGVDLGALRDEIGVWWDGGKPRGASTITMQVARNLFLWNDRSLLRKALEVPLALYIDLVLSKRRIMEIYLNTAQWGPVGEFGVEAGTRRAFGAGAAALSWERAALMAASLPNPLLRRPEKPGPHLRRVARVVEARARQAERNTACLRPPG